MQTWKLSNADDIAAANKYTYFKSSREAIALVRPGENVKLIFSFESDDPEAPAAERMWVLVDEVLPDGHFTGRLNNQPGWIKDFAPGDRVAFDASHIINTEHDSDDNLVQRYSKRCIVTHRVLHDGVKAGYLFREEPEDEQDSGWCISANDESDDYMDDPDNFAYVSLGRVLSNDDAFIALLDAEVGAQFVWDARTAAFIACPD